MSVVATPDGSAPPASRSAWDREALVRSDEGWSFGCGVPGSGVWTEYGPVAEADIRLLARHGVLAPTTLVREPGSKQFLPILQYPLLAEDVEFFRSDPPIGHRLRADGLPGWRIALTRMIGLGCLGLHLLGLLLGWCGVGYLVILNWPDLSEQNWRALPPAHLAGLVAAVPFSLLMLLGMAAGLGAIGLKPRSWRWMLLSLLASTLTVVLAPFSLVLLLLLPLTRNVLHPRYAHWAA